MSISLGLLHPNPKKAYHLGPVFLKTSKPVEFRRELCERCSYHLYPLKGRYRNSVFRNCGVNGKWTGKVRLGGMTVEEIVADSGLELKGSGGIIIVDAATGRGIDLPEATFTESKEEE